jgi:hypothetical protein
MTYKGIAKGKVVELEGDVTLPQGTRVNDIPEEPTVIITRTPSLTLNAWLQEARQLRAQLPMTSDSVELICQLREKTP